MEIKELAIAYWRLNKWVAGQESDHKMAAESALRTIREYLEDQHIVIQDITGEWYDEGLPVIVLNKSELLGCEGPFYISEMLQPIILQNDALALGGKVILKEMKGEKHE